MPHPNHINPDTGKRYGFVDAAKEEAKALRAVEKQVSVAKRLTAANDARGDLMAFTRFTMPDPEDPNNVEKSKYQNARFHNEVAEALEAVERGEIRQLIFAMPPRHGKTALATKSFAAWFWGKHPDQQIAVATYSDTMANDLGSDTRAILASSPYKQVFPDFKLRRGGTAKDNLESVQGGRCVFVGRGGALTGKGAHILLIDDLFKDHEEARSPTIRDQAWNWFTKVAMTRRMGMKLVIITMTRWHADDVIGRITDPESPHFNAIEAAKWKIIRLPAIAEEDDPLGREVGEPLWPDGPDQFDLDFLESQQRLDPLGFASLYQQSPSAADGTVFLRENVRRYDTLPDELRYYCASDHAVGVKQRNDPSCLLKVGVDDVDDIYMVESIWQRMKTDAAVEAMLTMGGGKRAPVLWWAEAGHITGSIGPFLRKRMLETGVYINIVEVPPKADKVQRAQSFAARFAMGKVKWPKAAWADKAIEELMAFPNGLHDDFVDACSYIGLGLQSQFGKKLSAKAAAPAPATGSVSWMKQMDKWNAEKRRSMEAGGF